LGLNKFVNLLLLDYKFQFTASSSKFLIIIVNVTAKTRLEDF